MERYDALNVQKDILAIIDNFQRDFELRDQNDNKAQLQQNFTAAISTYLRLIKSQEKHKVNLFFIESELLEELFVKAFDLLAEGHVPIGKSSKDFLLALFEEKVYSYAGFEKLILDHQVF